MSVLVWLSLLTLCVATYVAALKLSLMRFSRSVLEKRLTDRGQDELCTWLLAREADAKVAIPCHFWTFAEHNGDPGRFIEACKEEAPDVKVELMGQGGCYIYGK